MTAGEEGNIENMLERNNKMITNKKKHPVKPFTRPEITYRFEKHQKGIDSGVKAGALNKQEAAELRDNLAKAKAKYEKLSKDGNFTQAEEEKMHELLDKDVQIIQKKERN